VTLPPFSGDEPTCLKCGYAGARTEFLTMGDCVHGPGDRGVTLGWNVNERLHRECQRCQYQWDEAIVEPVDQGGDDSFVRQCPATIQDGLHRGRCIMPARHTDHHADGSGLRWDDSTATYPEEPTP
jgi:hypothetical protein